MSSKHLIDGIEYWRVTSIIGILEKYGLPQWASDSAVDHIIEEVYEALPADWDTEDDWSGATLDDVMIQPQQFAYTLHEARTAHKRISNEAKEVGQMVHALVHDFFPCGTHPTVRPSGQVLMAWRAFEKWVSKTDNINTIYTEHQVVHKTLGYAGTLDFYGIVDGKHLVIDWKTDKRIYPTTAMQIAAYLNALRDMFRHRDMPLPQIDAGAVLRLDKDTGDFQYKEYSLKTLRHEFAKFRKLLEYKKLCGRKK